jgi:ABC-2 type transport system permease protein
MVRSIRQIGNIAHKEILHVLRDRLVLLFLIFGPLVQLVLLGQSTSRTISHLPMAVIDYDQSSLSRLLVTTLDNLEEVHLVRFIESEDDLVKLLEQGQIMVGVVIPIGFERTIVAGGQAQVQVIVDGTTIAAGSIAGGAVEGAINDLSQRLALRGRAMIPRGIELRPQVLFNPTLSTRFYIIPAQLGAIVFQIARVVAALSFAKERELGTLEQLMITPIHRLELILGKFIPGMVIGVINFLGLYVIVRTVFAVPMNGDFLLLIALTLIFLAANVAFGMVLSLLSTTQQQAMLLVFLTAVLEINLSGYIVSIKNMPTFWQGVAALSPLQHYMTIVRSIMLKGAGLGALSLHVMAMIGLTVATVALALYLASQREA